MKNHRHSRFFALSAGRSRGFSIISAIFILVVLAALAAAILTVSTSQQLGAAADVSGTRAYLAARAGLEWGMYQVNSSNTWNYDAPDTRTCPAAATNSFAMPASAPTLAAFTVTVKCTVLTDTNGGHNVYQIDSWACNTPAAGACPGTVGTNYVERYVRVFM
jgi:MSHA biogenesis protein MshP